MTRKNNDMEARILTQAWSWMCLYGMSTALRIISFRRKSFANEINFMQIIGRLIVQIYSSL